jgi:cation transport regulator ChaC
MMLGYFAYGSNMNPARVRARGLAFTQAEGAVLRGFRLEFHKQSRHHPGSGHANIAFDREGIVEGVLYRLALPDEIHKMDPFERTPVNYSRDVVMVETASGTEPSWTYFANAGVLYPGLRPERAYLAHLLAGAPYLSAAYLARLARWPCADDRAEQCAKVGP